MDIRRARDGCGAAVSSVSMVQLVCAYGTYACCLY